MEECRRCLAARDEKTRRQLASEESAIDEMRSSLEAEELRLQTERQQHTARASEIGAKREETERCGSCWVGEGVMRRVWP